MNLYLLMPIDTQRYNSPWFNSKGTVAEMVVLAETESQARQIASDNAGAENRTQKPWKNRKLTQCVKLKNIPQVVSLIYSK